MLHVEFADYDEITTLSFRRTIDGGEVEPIADVTLGRRAAEVLLAELLNTEAVEVVRGYRKEPKPLLDGDPRVKTKAAP